MRVVAHCFIFLFHLVVLAAMLAGFVMRLNPALLYDVRGRMHAQTTKCSVTDTEVDKLTHRNIDALLHDTRTGFHRR